MTPGTTEFARQLFDFGVLAAAICLLLYAVSGGAVARPLYPRPAKLLQTTGAILFFAVYLADAATSVLLPAILQESVPAFLSRPIPESWYWLISRVAVVIFLSGLLAGTRHRKRLERAVNTSRDMIRDAQDSIARSEARFRYLFETTSNSIFCYVFDPPMPVSLPVEEQIRWSHDAVLTECNKEFARNLNTDSPSAVIGSRMGSLDGNKDTEAHRKYFGTFVQNDYRLTDYELVFTTPDGEDRAVRSSLTGIVKDGLLHRFWGAESNILDIRETRAALEYRRKYQELLASVSSRLVTAPVSQANEVMEQSMLELCKYVGADRTALMWYDRQSLRVDLAHSYTVAGTRFEAPISLSVYPRCTELLQQNKVIRVDDVDNPPAEVADDKDRFIERGIKSFIALPLAVDGEVVGVSTYVHTTKKRSWADHEIRDMRMFAELFASYVLRVRSRQALDEALQGLQHATDRLEAENVYLRSEIERTHGFDEIIGQSESLLRCLQMVDHVADTNTPVLVLGETGTGKELIARAIHDHSSRRDRPLVKINCAALPADLIESELFGYEKGAFTGADVSKPGRFDLADGSTLFLDEVGDIPLALQPKLLRALQEGEIERLGGNKTVKVDVRLIAATNRDLAAAVIAGEFRADLYYRINTFPIELPPLRSRGDDIQLLAEHFVNTHARALGREVSAISAGMMRQLREHSWPGNVRELDGVIQRALISSSAPILELADTLDGSRALAEEEGPRVLSTSIADLRIVEREHILSVLEEADWKISGASGAAVQLGIPPSTLRSKMKKLSISRPN